MNIGDRKGRVRGLLADDGRGVFVAFDHALGAGPSPGSEDARAVLEQVVEGGADAVLVSPGAARTFSAILKGRIKTILSIPTDPRYADYAATLGCEGVKTTFFGDVREMEQTKLQEDVALACQANGLEYLDEIVPAEPGTTKAIRDLGLIQFAARKAAELGADIVKTAYTGSAESFKAVVSTTFIPVVILGGEKTDDRGVLQMTHDMLTAGGSGVAYGRNVWGRKDPKAMVLALRAIVHEGKSVDDAQAILSGR